MAKAARQASAASTDDLRASIRRYEAWLAQELGEDMVAADLKRKHDRMRDGGFPFLRATYWRWAELAPALFPKLMECRSVLAVGDIHLENFGTWRDADGRLAWGVNDYDEAAEMPWPMDLARLATSAVLAGARSGEAAAAILEGYLRGLAAPAPFVLDGSHAWLRDAVLVPEADRQKFWDKLVPQPARPPARWRAALLGALPPGATDVRIWPRTAGTGSLGRPRWVALAAWRGGAVVREAKAMITSGWALARGADHPAGRALRVAEAATGPYRVPDPWFGLSNHIAVRRLSPNNRKIELAENAALLLSGRMLAAMGHDLANIHRAGAPAAAILKEQAALKKRWLERAAEAAAERVLAEQHAFAKG